MVFDTLVSGLGNAALNGVEIGTIWNDWQDFWTGHLEMLEVEIHQEI